MAPTFASERFSTPSNSTEQTPGPPPNAGAKKPASPRVPWLATIAVVPALVAVAYLRGNYLLGPAWGVVFALASAGALWLLARAFHRRGKPSIGRAAVAIALTGAVAFAVAFPTTLSPELGHLVSQRSTVRAVRTELDQVLKSDQVLRRLTFLTAQYKQVVVTISGTLPARGDLTRLRTRLVAECPTLASCALQWKIRLGDSDEVLDGFDRELFPAPNDDL